MNENMRTVVSAIAMSGVEDIRTVLDHYNQFDDPLKAFKENQRLLQVGGPPSQTYSSFSQQLLSLYCLLTLGNW